MILPAIPRDLRENMARALGHLRRNEPDRAIDAMTTALRRFSGLRLSRSARNAVHRQICDFLAELAAHPLLQPLMSPTDGTPQEIPYSPGKENTLITVLHGLGKILRDESAHSVRREAEARLVRKKILIETGVQMLQAGQVGTGSAFLKRVAAEFGEEEGIRLQLGQLFTAAGQHREAALMYESAMRAQPRESAAYTGAVAAWIKAGEYARAEATYLAILRTFGGHPSTFGKMAALYLAWGKFSQAREMAARALAEDSRQTDALAVMNSLTAEGSLEDEQST